MRTPLQELRDAIKKSYLSGEEKKVRLIYESTFYDFFLEKCVAYVNAGRGSILLKGAVFLNGKMQKETYFEREIDTMRVLLDDDFLPDLLREIGKLLREGRDKTKEAKDLTVTRYKFYNKKPRLTKKQAQEAFISDLLRQIEGD